MYDTWSIWVGSKFLKSVLFDFLTSLTKHFHMVQRGENRFESTICIYIYMLDFSKAWQLFYFGTVISFPF